MTTTTIKKHGSKAEELLLRRLFVNELMKMYWAERQLGRLLNTMGRKACSPDLASCFKGHLQATTDHTRRLEQVFRQMGLAARAKKFPAMEQFIQDARLIIKLNKRRTLLRDTAMIRLAGKIEYLEVEKYLDLKQIADLLGEDKASFLLAETIEEEREAWESFDAVNEDIERELSLTIEIPDESYMQEEEPAELEAS